MKSVFWIPMLQNIWMIYPYWIDCYILIIPLKRQKGLCYEAPYSAVRSWRGVWGWSDRGDYIWNKELWNRTQCDVSTCNMISKSLVLLLSVIPGGVISIKRTFSSFFLNTDTCITLHYIYITLNFHLHYITLNGVYINTVVLISTLMVMKTMMTARGQGQAEPLMVTRKPGHPSRRPGRECWKGY